MSSFAAKSKETIFIPSSELRKKLVNPLTNVTHHYDDNDEDDNDEDDNDEDDNVTLESIEMPRELIDRMYEHQRDGVKWMYNLHTNANSCMVQRVLIIAPVSVILNWQRELNQHMRPHVKDCSFEVVSAELSKKKRLQILQETFQPAQHSSRHSRVVVTSYHLVANMIDAFTAGAWDYVILDEGHVIKNPSTKISKSINSIACKKRLLLTGTPIQNNLTEFWSLLNFVTDGKVFGSQSDFQSRYGSAIISGQNPNASAHATAMSSVAIKALMKKVRPILLQRKKCEKSALLKLTDKVEVVLWVPLSQKQRQVYCQYLGGREVTQALNRVGYPVEIINHLKTLCRHPLLLEAAKRKKEMLAAQASSGCAQASFIVDDDEEGDGLGGLAEDLQNLSVANGCARADGESSAPRKYSQAHSIFELLGSSPSKDDLLRDSVKLSVLVQLVGLLRAKGRRLLIFSQSKLMIDIIQRVLADDGHASCRIDGSVTGRDRQRIIDNFNATPDTSTYRPHICMLTTRACGYGITLTGADRVIIFDPSWNPAEDRQAVDRAFRIGQLKDVVVYRMIMASSVEEKMYEKQVFKDGLRVVAESGSSSRYFSQEETRALFTLGPAESSAVMLKLWDMHPDARAGAMALRADYCSSTSDSGWGLPGLLGITRHDKLYSEERPEAMQTRRIGISKTPTKGSRSGRLGGAGGRARPIDLSGSVREVVDLVGSGGAPGLVSGEAEEEEEGELEWLDGSNDDNNKSMLHELSFGSDSVGESVNSEEDEEQGGEGSLGGFIAPDDEEEEYAQNDSALLDEDEDILSDAGSGDTDGDDAAADDDDDEYGALDDSDDVFICDPPEVVAPTAAVLLSDDDCATPRPPRRRAGRIRDSTDGCLGSTTTAAGSGDRGEAIFGERFTGDIDGNRSDKDGAGSESEASLALAVEYDEDVDCLNSLMQAVAIQPPSPSDTVGDEAVLALLREKNYSHFKKVKVSFLTRDMCADKSLIGKAIAQKHLSNPSSASGCDTNAAFLGYKGVDTSAVCERPFVSLLGAGGGIERYNDSVARGQRCEMQKDYVSAVCCYAEAVDICDEDVLLHGKLAYLSQKVGIL